MAMENDPNRMDRVLLPGLSYSYRQTESYPL